MVPAEINEDLVQNKCRARGMQEISLLASACDEAGLCKYAGTASNCTYPGVRIPQVPAR